jgi:hypothetical protein
VRLVFSSLVTEDEVRNVSRPVIVQVLLSVIVCCQRLSILIRASAGQERIMWLLSSRNSPQRRQVGSSPGCCLDWG